MPPSNEQRTHLAFHYDGKSLSHSTQVVSVIPFASLEESSRALFKQGSPEDHAVVTTSTIFHPQGGGQPSDEGSMQLSSSSSSSSSPTFAVSAVRTDVVVEGRVLHFGRFGDGSEPFAAGSTVTQAVDGEKRTLYSRLHTAGHVLGSAVRALVEKEVDGFDELKASHFPDSAACEFEGRIGAEWKERIQGRVDEYVAAAMPVQIEWWSEDEFRENGYERLIPDRVLLAPGETKFRVVRIVGAEVYPCGGTHVDTTDLCGKTTVRKIQRNKNVSRVAYAVA